jgi:hypothetical protein
MEADGAGRLFSAAIAETAGVPVRSVVNLSDIVRYIRDEGAASLGVPETALDELAGLIARREVPA